MIYVKENKNLPPVFAVVVVVAVVVVDLSTKCLGGQNSFFAVKSLESLWLISKTVLA